MMQTLADYCGVDPLAHQLELGPILRGGTLCGMIPTKE